MVRGSEWSEGQSCQRVRVVKGSEWSKGKQRFDLSTTTYGFVAAKMRCEISDQFESHMKKIFTRI